MSVQAAAAFLEVGRTEQAREQLSTVLASEPANVEALCLLVSCELADGDLPAMGRTARAAVAAGPQSAAAHRWLSLALFKLERPRESLVAADEAIRLEPHSPAGYVLRAYAHSGVPFGRRAAWRDLRRAEELAPHWATVPAARAELLAAYRRPRAARRAYAEALRIDPDNPHAIGGLGVLAVRQGRFGTALRLFGTVAADRPTDALAQAGLRTVVLGAAAWALLAAWAILLVLAIAAVAGAPAVVLLAVVLVPAALFAAGVAVSVARLPPALRGVARSLMRTEPGARRRLVAAAVTLVGAVALGVYAAVTDTLPPLLVLAVVVWLPFVGGVVWLVERRATPRREPARDEEFAPESGHGRLFLWWLRVTALAAAPTVLLAVGGAAWSDRVTVATGTLLGLGGVYGLTLWRWRRHPGRALTGLAGRTRPGIRNATVVLVLIVAIAGYVPARPPLALVTFAGGAALLALLWVPVAAVRAVARRIRSATGDPSNRVR